MRAATADHDAVARFVSTLPPELDALVPLAQDQYVEMRTLLAGYILSSQGDRMLMAHSVEGRFPFLDANVVALACSLPDAYKLRVLDEKHVVKRAARGLVPDAIIAPQEAALPRARRARILGARPRPTGSATCSPRAPSKTPACSIPAPSRSSARRCLRKDGAAQFSNADNMAIVGVLSTQLLHRRFIRGS